MVKKKYKNNGSENFGCGSVSHTQPDVSIFIVVNSVIGVLSDVCSSVPLSAYCAACLSSDICVSV